MHCKSATLSARYPTHLLRPAEAQLLAADLRRLAEVPGRQVQKAAVSWLLACLHCGGVCAGRLGQQAEHHTCMLVGGGSSAVASGCFGTVLALCTGSERSETTLKAANHRYRHPKLTISLLSVQCSGARLSQQMLCGCQTPQTQMDSPAKMSMKAPKSAQRSLSLRTQVEKMAKAVSVMNSWMTLSWGAVKGPPSPA